MVNSAIIGAAFAVVFGGMVVGIGSGVGYGLGYGVIWWLLGPLTLMPLLWAWDWESTGTSPP